MVPCPRYGPYDLGPLGSMDGHVCISDAVVDHQKHTILFQLAICRVVCCTVSGSALFAVQFQGEIVFWGLLEGFQCFEIMIFY